MSDREKQHNLAIPGIDVFSSKTELVNDKFKVDLSCQEYATEKIYKPHEHRVLSHPNKNIMKKFSPQNGGEN